ncbi:MAG: MFS transporter [Spirochaetia bacterium]|jgi:Na+/melibiose symporter-like transporter|nr:MFS transporter [Spirochaetia bacterium]
MSSGRPRLSLGQKIIFALGQFGWSLTTFLANNLLSYFFLPPETGKEAMPAFVPQGAIAGFLTVVGLAAFSARLFDAVNDPLIAGLSDRSRSRFGRRRTFMALGALPSVFFALAQFFPPIQGIAPLNTVWLFVMALGGTVCLTMYVMPYSALIAELGADSKDRLFLSALTSVTWALGFASGNAVYAIKDALMSSGVSPLEAFHQAVAILGAAAAIMMLLPVFLIDEKKYASGGVSETPAFSAIRLAMKDKPFRILVSASFLYYTANTFLEIGIAYYVSALMGLAESAAFTLAATIFGLSFLWYPAVMKLASVLGKKRTLSMGFIAQLVVFAIIPMVGLIPSIPTLAWMAFIALFQSVASAAFGILPTAMVADAAHKRSESGGMAIEGAYFGVNSFAMKLAVSTANLAFPSLLLFGRSAERSTGIRLSGVLAAVLTLAGWVVLRAYTEDPVPARQKPD